MNTAAASAGTEGVWPLRLVDALANTQELEIAVQRRDGSSLRAVPIWMVVVDGRLYVRTWYRRGGWYGAALRSGRAAIRVVGATAEVAVVDLGNAPIDLQRAIDSAFRTKYGRHGHGAVRDMVSARANATTMLLTPLTTTT